MSTNPASDEPSGAERAGWKLVPVEPTQAMEEAAFNATNIRNRWAAMLAAAPSREPEPAPADEWFPPSPADDVPPGYFDKLQDLLSGRTVERLGQTIKHLQDALEARNTELAYIKNNLLAQADEARGEPSSSGALVKTLDTWLAQPLNPEQDKALDELTSARGEPAQARELSDEELLTELRNKLPPYTQNSTRAYALNCMRIAIALHHARGGTKEPAPWVPAPGECPYSIGDDDGTVKQCVERGHCGCDEGNP